MGKTYLLECNYSAENRDGFVERDKNITSVSDKDAIKLAKLSLKELKHRFKNNQHFIDAELFDEAGRRVKYWGTKALAKF